MQDKNNVAIKYYLNLSCDDFVYFPNQVDEPVKKHGFIGNDCVEKKGIATPHKAKLV
jgi:hypothetical protein